MAENKPRGLKDILLQAKRVSVDELKQPLRIRTIYWNSLKYLPYVLIGYPIVSLYIKSNEKANPKRFLIILALYQKQGEWEWDFTELDCEVYPPMIVKAEVNKKLAEAIKIVYEAEKEELEELKEKPLEIIYKAKNSFELNILDDVNVPSISQFIFEHSYMGNIEAYIEVLRGIREERKLLTEAQFDELYINAFRNEIDAYKECLRKKAIEEAEIEEDDLEF